MTQEKPLITIGITSFNAGEMIVDAIQCALSQDWGNVEVIVVDDASSDNSVAIISDYIQGHANARLIEHSENKGFPSALNTIIENTNGEYVAFFDDDDFSDPSRLSKQYKRLSRHMDEFNTPLVMCYTNRIVRDQYTNQEICRFKGIGNEPGKEPRGSIVADYILWHSGKIGFSWGMFGSCTLLVNVQIFKEIGFFDPQFKRSAEWDMAIRCALAGGHFISVDEPMIIQKKTLTQDKAAKKPLEFALMLREKHRSYLAEKNVYAASRLVAYSRFCKGKGKVLLSYFYWALAAIVSPHRVGLDVLAKAHSKLIGCFSRGSK